MYESCHNLGTENRVFKVEILFTSEFDFGEAMYVRSFQSYLFFIFQLCDSNHKNITRKSTLRIQTQLQRKLEYQRSNTGTGQKMLKRMEQEDDVNIRGRVTCVGYLAKMEMMHLSSKALTSTAIDSIGDLYAIMSGLEVNEKEEE